MVSAFMIISGLVMDIIGSTLLPVCCRAGAPEVVSFLPPPLAVPALFQDPADRIEVVAAITQGPLTGFNQPLIAHLFGEAQHTHAGLVALLRMLLTVQDFLDIKLDIFMDGPGPFQKAFRRPLADKAVRSGHMLFIRRIVMRAFGSVMQGDPVVTGIDLHALAAVKQLHFLTDEPVRNAVVMLVYP